MLLVLNLDNMFLNQKQISRQFPLMGNFRGSVPVNGFRHRMRKMKAMGNRHRIFLFRLKHKALRIGNGKVGKNGGVPFKYL